MTESVPPPPPQVTAAMLTGSAWLVGHDDQPPYPGETLLLESGATGGMRGGYFALWRIIDGRLAFTDGRGTVTVVFDPPACVNGRLLFSGSHVGTEHPHKTIRVEEYRRLDADRLLGGFAALPQSQHLRNYLAQQFPAFIDRWSIGDHSYGHPSILEPSMARLTIGRFVSVAGGTNIALGGHRIDGLSSYPFAALRHVWPGAIDGSSHSSKGDVAIGNDVWLGVSCFIGSGITIGDGAVVGAHASVTRDVPPYAIVVGNPARVVRLRFDEATIERLLRIRWWDWEDDVIAAAMPAITAADVATFLRYCSERMRA